MPPFIHIFGQLQQKRQPANFYFFPCWKCHFFLLRHPMDQVSTEMINPSGYPQWDLCFLKCFTSFACVTYGLPLGGLKESWYFETLVSWVQHALKWITRISVTGSILFFFCFFNCQQCSKWETKILYINYQQIIANAEVSFLAFIIISLRYPNIEFLLWHTGVF